MIISHRVSAGDFGYVAVNDCFLKSGANCRPAQWCVQPKQQIAHLTQVTARSGSEFSICQRKTHPFLENMLVRMVYKSPKGIFVSLFF